MGLGVTDIYNNEYWDEEEDCIRYTKLFYYGNPNDTAQHFFPDYDNNLAKNTFEKQMKKIENNQNYKKLMEMSH